MNQIELKAATLFVGSGQVAPLDFASATRPASCAFVDAITAFACVCATTADARAKAAAWGVTLGFMDGVSMTDSASGRPQGDFSVAELAELRLNTI